MGKIMNKPKKPTKRRAPRKFEKPQEYLDREDYSVHLDNYDGFYLIHKIQGEGVDINDVDLNSIFIEIDIDGASSHWR